MKAIFLKKYGIAETAFELQETPQPIIKQGEVLIKVATFGLNYADVMARNNLYEEAPKTPCVLGYEVVGEISESLDVDFKVGEKVLAFTRFGGYAEFVAADKRAVITINPTIPNGQAAALATQYCTAYYSAILCANVQPFHKVLIHAGAGGVGTALIQICKNIGCQIYTTASSAEKLKYAKNQGADFGFNYSKEYFEKEIATANPDNFDVIFDSIGGALFKKNKKLLAKGGKIICFGGAARTSTNIFTSLKFVIDFGLLSPIFLLMNSQGIIGVNMLRIADEKPDIIQLCLQKTTQLFENKIIEPFIDKQYPVSEIATAHAYLESRKSKGKIVINW